MKHKDLAGSFIVLILLTSCLSVSKMSDFPKTATAIPFERYAIEYHEKKEPFWTSKTSNEYYFEKETAMPETVLANVIQYALKEKKYTIKEVDTVKDYIIGSRGLHANEWSSITAVYYKLNNDQTKIQVYIKTKITQDITGGWSENRAKKVGEIIEREIH